MCELIKKHEGLRLQAYLCPKGYWTIGYGNRFHLDGSPVKEGDEITKEKAEILLNDYLIKEVYPVIDGMGIQFTPKQKDALACLIYNWNAKGFRNSKLYQAIKKRDWASVCREWDYGFKNNLLGLFKRRTEELALFMADAK